MHIKRFEAATMEEALAAVRATLGPEALILSTRTLSRGRGAFGLLSRPIVEVQAAIERGRARGGPSLGSAGRDDLPAEARGSQPANGFAAEGVGELGELGDLLERLRREVAALRRREGFEAEVRSELRGLRAALARIDRDASSGPSAEADPVARRLVAVGIDERHVRSLDEAARARRAEGESGSLEALLVQRIDGRLAAPRFDPKQRVRILVGAPGVGKTTTLAKLAGRSEEAERDVAFVSLDPYRVGARDQLRAFADLLGAPYSELGSAREIAEVAARRRDEAILVDTAGRSPGDLDRQTPLETLRDVLGERASIELVVDATSRCEIAREQLRRFASLTPDRLILTKIDECDSLAPVVNLLLEEGCPPVCWLGTGQRVPEDLELAEPGRFVRPFLGRAA
ncbi:MAG: flagellar biosynthesis protein FlhF [Myxococcota bacterium]